ncbi:hypothetical protein M9H77_11685 [Catharanthus roseus]|uniref:Uncharacterized protein n=1 Tax=Catharanthus roseus TaxID=4058 RepID=A0ACC0BFC2_CATRO|nr:hypothetical protein M9H77_11685 [Catharanthus roseus]
MGLRRKQDFVKLFNHVLKDTDKVPKFEFHWRRLFEDQFMEYCQGLLAYNDGEHVYEVWRPDMIVFRHTVVYNENTLNISCTCRMFFKVGIFCSYCLHVFNIFCVQSIQDKYILKRWMKDIDVSGGSSGVGDARKGSKNDMECIEEGFKMIKDKIIAEVGPYYADSLENEGRSSGIKDPVGRRAKGVHNVRKKSIVEIKCN